MIDPNQVLSLALGHMAPPTWRVLPAQRSHFITNIVGSIIGVLLVLAGLAYLYLNPNFVVGLRGGTDIDSLFTFWRVADFVVGGALFAALVWATISFFGELEGQKYQALVLLPEGFVMQRGTTAKTMTTVNYSNVAGLKSAVNSGVQTLIFTGAAGRGTLRLRLDGRHGKPKQVAALIASGYAQFASQQVRPN